MPPPVRISSQEHNGLDPPFEARVARAARLKAQHASACADAFASATAIAHQVVPLTGDPELLLPEVPWRPKICAVGDHAT